MGYEGITGFIWCLTDNAVTNPVPIKVGYFLKQLSSALIIYSRRTLLHGLFMTLK
jgi:hypothetical protein